MTLRDQRQLEFANIWLNSSRRGILLLAARFGKIFTTINILEKFPPHSTILIAYPDLKIKQSWIDDFEKRGYDNPNITYTTHLSLHKYQNKIFDIVIIDEVHLLSEAQIEVCRVLLEENKQVIALTGTLAKDSEDILYQELSLPVIATYPIEQAIEEGVIVDYEITVMKVPLDNVVVQDFGKKQRTEKKHFDSYSWVINNVQYSGGDTMFLRLARMRIIQNSIAKRDATKRLLNQWKNERVLVFCGVKKVADGLGCPTFHSDNSKEKQVFTDFAEGKGKHLAVIRIGNTGVSYKPLNKVIINYFDSNAENLAQKIQRCMAMEYNNPNKKAQIYIISSTEQVELRWLEKALVFFDKDKIKYV